MQGEWAVECRNISVSFTGDSCELGGIDLQIRRGEYVSLVGPSGCGKSTLLRVIAGLLRPTCGTATVFGNSGGPSQRQIGFVFQDATLLPWRTALDNVALPLEIRGINRDDRRARAMEVLGEVGLGHATGRYPSELSGGMRQRVALARAMVEQSQVLLLDEPFAAVDALRRERFAHEMWRFGHKRGLTVVLVTHSISEAVWMSDRVVVMAEKPGHIVDIVDVDLGAERSSAVLMRPEYIQACGAVRSLLEENGGMSGAGR